MIELKIKRPRKHRTVRLWLHERNSCAPCGECPGCLARMQDQVDNERPGHVWAAENGEIVYMEDKVMESRLGRKLAEDETVIHINGNLLDNRDSNLELVKIPDLGTA